MWFKRSHFLAAFLLLMQLCFCGRTVASQIYDDGASFARKHRHAIEACLINRNTKVASHKTHINRSDPTNRVLVRSNYVASFSLAGNCQPRLSEHPARSQSRDLWLIYRSLLI